MTGASVRHSATATAIGDAANSLPVFARSRGVDGRHDVIGHGNDIGEPIVNGMATHPEQIAEAVRENLGYDGGAITLVMCHGGRSTAQVLAQSLGVDMCASTRRVQLGLTTESLILDVR